MNLGNNLQQFKLVLPKLPGYGKPICTGNGFTYGELTTQLRDVLNKYEVTHATVKVGTGHTISAVDTISQALWIVTIDNEKYNLVCLNKE